MALVKMYRDEPEVAGGNTEAMIPEEAVHLAMDNGWKLKEKVAEKKPELKPEVKEEPKVEKPVKEIKPEAPKVEKSEEKKAKK